MHPSIHAANTPDKPAYVIGDGVATLAALVETRDVLVHKVNPVNSCTLSTRRKAGSNQDPQLSLGD